MAACNGPCKPASVRAPHDEGPNGIAPPGPRDVARGTTAGKRGEERAAADEANGAPFVPYLIMEKIIAGTSGSPAG